METNKTIISKTEEKSLKDSKARIGTTILENSPIRALTRFLTACEHEEKNISIARMYELIEIFKTEQYRVDASRIVFDKFDIQNLDRELLNGDIRYKDLWTYNSQLHILITYSGYLYDHPTDDTRSITRYYYIRETEEAVKLLMLCNSKQLNEEEILQFLSKFPCILIDSDENRVKKLTTSKIEWLNKAIQKIQLREV